MKLYELVIVTWSHMWHQPKRKKRHNRRSGRFPQGWGRDWWKSMTPIWVAIFWKLGACAYAFVTLGQTFGTQQPLLRFSHKPGGLHPSTRTQASRSIDLKISAGTEGTCSWADPNQFVAMATKKVKKMANRWASLQFGDWWRQHESIWILKLFNVIHIPWKTAT